MDKTFSYPHFRRVAVYIYKSYPQMGDNFVDILRITFFEIIFSLQIKKFYDSDCIIQDKRFNYQKGIKRR